MNTQLERLQSSIRSIEDRLRADPSLIDRMVLRISSWTVGQHWDHLLKVDGRVFRSLTSGQSFEIKKPKSFVARIVLLFGFIPRGVRRSPEPVAGLRSDLAELQRQLTEMNGYLANYKHDPKIADVPFMEHPFLGAFSRNDWLRFVNVHHNHHEKIIRDILRA